MRGNLVEAFKNVIEAHERVTSEFSRVLAGAKHLWDSDPLLEVSALCMQKYGEVHCADARLLELGPTRFDEFFEALNEVVKAGLEPSHWQVSSVAIEWPPAKELSDKLMVLARLLAVETGVPVEVHARYLAVSNERGHVGGSIRILACVPSEYGIESLGWRVNALLGVLEKHGIDKYEIIIEERSLPYKVFNPTLAYCVGVGLGYSERRQPQIQEEPGDYMLILDENIERYYPVDPDSIEAWKPHMLYWYLPRYEPPWPCPEDLYEALQELNPRIILNYDHGAIVSVKGGIIQVDCGPIPGDNTIRVLEGDRGLLIKLIKILAKRWAEKVLQDEELRSYLQALERATTLREIVETARDAED